MGGKIIAQQASGVREHSSFGTEKEKEDLHELIVPANALWDIGFCDTDRLLTRETKSEKETVYSKVKADKNSGSARSNMTLRRGFHYQGSYQERQLERSPETKAVLFKVSLNCEIIAFPERAAIVISSVSRDLQET